MARTPPPQMIAPSKLSFIVIVLKIILNTMANIEPIIKSPSGIM